MEAAFFDLDKTVIAKTSIIAYAPTLRKNGYLSIPMAVRTAWGHLLFKFFGADEESLEWEEVEIFLSKFKEAFKTRNERQAHDLLINSVSGFKPYSGLNDLIYKSKKNKGNKLL